MVNAVSTTLGHGADAHEKTFALLAVARAMKDGLLCRWSF